MVVKDHIMQEGLVLSYQPNAYVSLSVKLQDDTVWLTQYQIADLFGVKQPAVSKHLKNIFATGELREDRVYSILEYTAADGKKYKTKFYNLDATFDKSHDRFLLIDDVVYHIGASIKDAGKKWFAIMKMNEISASDLLRKMGE